MSSTDVKEQILMASGPIFAQRGYEKATVREICAAAAVNVAAVNYYFGDKQQLYIESVKRAYERRSSQIPMPSWPPGANAEAMFRGFVMTLVRRMVVMDDAPWESRLLLREVLHPTDACKTLVQNFFRPQMERLMSILGQLLPSAVPLARRRKIAFSVVGQCMFYRVASDVVSMMVPADELRQQYTLEQLGHHIAETILAAIHHCPEEWLEDPNETRTGDSALAESLSPSNSDEEK
jgi:AcrR family transcriptional regulator